MGGGKLLIDDGAKLTLGGADANSVVFEGASGTLKLLHPETMTGKITGLQVGNIIDLAGIDATHASVSHGVLTVTESNADTLTFHIGGTLQGTRFVIKLTGHGGSDLELKSTTPAETHPSAFLTVDAHGHASYQTGHDSAYEISYPAQPAPPIRAPGSSIHNGADLRDHAVSPRAFCGARRLVRMAAEVRGEQCQLRSPAPARGDRQPGPRGHPSNAPRARIAVARWSAPRPPSLRCCPHRRTTMTCGLRHVGERAGSAPPRRRVAQHARQQDEIGFCHHASATPRASDGRAPAPSAIAFIFPERNAARGRYL